MQPLSKQAVLDLYFVEARARLIDLAAFLDRVERAPGEADYRLAALRTALEGDVTAAGDKQRTGENRAPGSERSDDRAVGSSHDQERGGRVVGGKFFVISGVCESGVA